MQDISHETGDSHDQTLYNDSDFESLPSDDVDAPSDSNAGGLTTKHGEKDDADNELMQEVNERAKTDDSLTYSSDFEEQNSLVSHANSQQSQEEVETWENGSAEYDESEEERTSLSQPATTIESRDEKWERAELPTHSTGSADLEISHGNKGSASSLSNSNPIDDISQTVESYSSFHSEGKPDLRITHGMKSLDTSASFQEETLTEETLNSKISGSKQGQSLDNNIPAYSSPHSESEDISAKASFQEKTLTEETSRSEPSFSSGLSKNGTSDAEVEALSANKDSNASTNPRQKKNTTSLVQSNTEEFFEESLTEQTSTSKAHETQASLPKTSQFEETVTEQASSAMLEGEMDKTEENGMFDYSEETVSEQPSVDDVSAHGEKNGYDVTANNEFEETLTEQSLSNRDEISKSQDNKSEQFEEETLSEQELSINKSEIFKKESLTKRSLLASNRTSESLESDVAEFFEQTLTQQSDDTDHQNKTESKGSPASEYADEFFEESITEQSSANGANKAEIDAEHPHDQMPENNEDDTIREKSSPVAVRTRNEHHKEETITEHASSDDDNLKSSGSAVPSEHISKSLEESLSEHTLPSADKTSVNEDGKTSPESSLNYSKDHFQETLSNHSKHTSQEMSEADVKSLVLSTNEQTCKTLANEEHDDIPPDDKNGTECVVNEETGSKAGKHEAALTEEMSSKNDQETAIDKIFLEKSMEAHELFEESISLNETMTDQNDVTEIRDNKLTEEMLKNTEDENSTEFKAAAEKSTHEFRQIIQSEQEMPITADLTEESATSMEIKKKTDSMNCEQEEYILDREETMTDTSLSHPDSRNNKDNPAPMMELKSGESKEGISNAASFLENVSTRLSESNAALYKICMMGSGRRTNQLPDLGTLFSDELKAANAFTTKQCVDFGRVQESTFDQQVARRESNAEKQQENVMEEGDESSVICQSSCSSKDGEANSSAGGLFQQGEMCQSNVAKLDEVANSPDKKQVVTNKKCPEGEINVIQELRKHVMEDVINAVSQKLNKCYLTKSNHKKGMGQGEISNTTKRISTNSENVISAKINEISSNSGELRSESKKAVLEQLDEHVRSAWDVEVHHAVSSLPLLESKLRAHAYRNLENVHERNLSEIRKDTMHRFLKKLDDRIELLLSRQQMLHAARRTSSRQSESSNIKMDEFVKKKISQLKLNAHKHLERRDLINKNTEGSEGSGNSALQRFVEKRFFTLQKDYHPCHKLLPPTSNSESSGETAVSVSWLHSETEFKRMAEDVGKLLDDIAALKSTET